MKKYFIHNGTEQIGPLSIEELKIHQIKKDTPIWIEGMEEWTIAGELEELNYLFPPMPPPFIKQEKEEQKEESKEEKVEKPKDEPVIARVEKEVKPKRSTFGNIFKAARIIVIIGLLGYGGYVGYLMLNGHSFESAVNPSKTYDLKVSCSGFSSDIITSSVLVNISNSSNRIHNDIVVRVSAYDKKGNVIKVKEVELYRTLEAHDSKSKLVMLPAKARDCKCELVSSNPM
jgi:hypothetical protein